MLRQNSRFRIIMSPIWILLVFNAERKVATRSAIAEIHLHSTSHSAIWFLETGKTDSLRLDVTMIAPHGFVFPQINDPQNASKPLSCRRFYFSLFWSRLFVLLAADSKLDQDECFLCSSNRNNWNAESVHTYTALAHSGQPVFTLRATGLERSVTWVASRRSTRVEATGWTAPNKSHRSAWMWRRKASAHHLQSFVLRFAKTALVARSLIDLPGKSTGSWKKYCHFSW